jgi:addiction module HigA family antidote
LTVILGLIRRDSHGSVRGQRAITPETALRLARYFGGSAAIWLRLQVAFDLARVEADLAAKINAEVTPAAA